LIHDRRLNAFSRLIEQEQLGIRQDRAADRQLLLLSAAQAAAWTIENLW
jgi:hypothetical protein